MKRKIILSLFFGIAETTLNGVGGIVAMVAFDFVYNKRVVYTNEKGGWGQPHPPRLKD